jgi:hypothetical protein
MSLSGEVRSWTAAAGSGGPKRYSPQETIIPAQNAKKTTAGEDPRRARRLTRNARACLA